MVIDRLGKTLTPTKGSKIFNRPAFPEYCTDLRQTGNEWVNFTVLRISCNPAPGIDPERRTASAARKRSEVSLDPIREFEGMSDVALGHIAKCQMGIKSSRVRESNKFAASISHPGNVVKDGAETESVGQIERIEVTLRPPNVPISMSL